MSLGIMKHLGQKDPKEYNCKHKSEGTEMINVVIRCNWEGKKRHIP